jgi:hypothetical protein
MMNKTKFFLNLLLVPVYFTLVLVLNIVDAFLTTCLEVKDAIRSTKRMYW